MPSKRAVEAARAACGTTREWATLALNAAEPIIRSEEREALREKLLGVEEAVCGYVVGLTPKEGTLGEIDREFVCKRCLKKAGDE